MFKLRFDWRAKNSGNFGSDVNGTRLFGSFHWKFSGLNGIPEKDSPVFPLETTVNRFLVFITSSRPPSAPPCFNKLMAADQDHFSKSTGPTKCCMNNSEKFFCNSSFTGEVYTTVSSSDLIKLSSSTET